MATTNQAIGARVRALIDGHSMTQAGLASMIQIDPAGLSRAINGDRPFKAREIARIAEVFGVSPALILDGEAPESVALAARQNLPNQESVQHAVERADFYRDLTDLVGGSFKARSLRAPVPTEYSHVDGEEFAVRVLKETGLGSEALPVDMHVLARTIEDKLGIQVALEPLQVGMDGLSLSSQRLHLAMVNTSVAAARQRWTLIHEVGHLLLGDAHDKLLVDSNIYAKGPTETRVNAFAAAFLLPADLLGSVWGDGNRITDSRIATALDIFGVSIDALAFRLHNIGLVNAAGRDRVRSRRASISVVRNQGTRQSEGFWFPSQLSHATIKAYNEGRVGVRWLAALMQLDVERLVDRLKPDPGEVDFFDATA